MNVIDFTERRLSQLEPLGAWMGTHAYRDGEKLPMVWVSTIQLAGHYYTRVELHEEGFESEMLERVHFAGEIDTREAAAQFWGSEAY